MTAMLISEDFFGDVREEPGELIKVKGISFDDLQKTRILISL